MSVMTTMVETSHAETLELHTGKRVRIGDLEGVQRWRLRPDPVLSIQSFDVIHIAPAPPVVTKDASTQAEEARVLVDAATQAAVDPVVEPAVELVADEPDDASTTVKGPDVEWVDELLAAIEVCPGGTLSMKEIEAFVQSLREKKEAVISFERGDKEAVMKRIAEEFDFPLKSWRQGRHGSKYGTCQKVKGLILRLPPPEEGWVDELLAAIEVCPGGTLSMKEIEAFVQSLREKKEAVISFERGDKEAVMKRIAEEFDFPLKSWRQGRHGSKYGTCQQVKGLILCLPPPEEEEWVDELLAALEGCPRGDDGRLTSTEIRAFAKMIEREKGVVIDIRDITMRAIQQRILSAFKITGVWKRAGPSCRFGQCKYVNGVKLGVPPHELEPFVTEVREYNRVKRGK